MRGRPMIVERSPRYSPAVEVIDTIDAQLRELVRTRNPRLALEDERADRFAASHVGGIPQHDYGRWIHYPWLGRVVHVLGPAEFFELRSVRNRYKLLPGEQVQLATKRIGVVGLSVGATLALEGIGGRLRLADPDHLDLSNLNRLRARAADGACGPYRAGGEPVPRRRRLLRQADRGDPRAVPRRARPRRRQCDDLRMKLRLREAAKAAGIPVVMQFVTAAVEGLADRLPTQVSARTVALDEAVHHPIGVSPSAITHLRRRRPSH